MHGWGGRADDLEQPAAELAGAGWLAAAISMRGFGSSEGVDDCGLRQPDDVVAVARQLRAERPELRSIALFGISQGGQVALLAAARLPEVAAVTAWAPVTDVGRWRATTAHPLIPAYIDDRCRDGQLQVRSPLAVAPSLSMPVLLVHGDADTRVPTDQSRLLHAAITAAGGTSVLELLEGVEHRRGPDGNRRAMHATMTFLDQHAR